MVEQSTAEVRATVEFLRSKGFTPLPIRLDSKATYCEDFASPSFVSPLKDWEKSNVGVGVVLGGRTRLIDIDLDDKRIAQLADAMLPPTPWVFGRPGKKLSHRLYLCSTVAPEQQDFDDKLNTFSVKHLKREGVDPTPIIEFRGNNSQTVMPGTLHAGTGQRITWRGGKAPDSLPAKADPVDLALRVKLLGLVVLTADNVWDAGSRHDVALCLSGMLAYARVKESDALEFFSRLIDFSGAGDRGNVLAACRDTCKSQKAGRAVAAGPRLAEITGRADFVHKFRTMFSDVQQAILEGFNAGWAVLCHHSKVRVLNLASAERLDEPEFTLLSPEDFHALHANKRVTLPDSKGSMIPRFASKVWFEHPLRRTYDDTEFEPGKPQDDGPVFNLWRGWAARPSPHKLPNLWLEHVRDHVAGGDELLFHWIMAWFADIIQHPASKPGTALVMHSGQGTGKNTVSSMMGRVLGGRYYCEMVQSAHITGRHNAHLRTAMLVMANEAVLTLDNKISPIVKGLITDGALTVEPKFVDARTVRNFSRVIITSNQRHVVIRDVDDRRFTVAEVLHPKEAMGPDKARKYFKDIWDEISGEGPSGLMYYLQQYKYDRDMLRTAFETQAGIEQRAMSMSPVLEWWVSRLCDGYFRVPEGSEDRISTSGTKAWPEWISRSLLEETYREDTKGTRGSRVSSTEFFTEIYNRTGIEKDWFKHRISTGARPRVQRMPSLEECVALMEERYPGVVEGPEKYRPKIDPGPEPSPGTSSTPDSAPPAEDDELPLAAKAPNGSAEHPAARSSGSHGPTSAEALEAERAARDRLF